MSMSDLERAFEFIAASGEPSDFVGPRKQRLIERAEEVLGLTFPPTYRRFLQDLGCGDIAAVEVYGLIDDNFWHSSIPDGIWLTMEERRTSKLPQSYVLVYSTGDGAYYALDTAKRDALGENPVVMWFPGWSAERDGLNEVFTDFGSFFYKTIADALRDWQPEDTN
ncbi:MAG TPA: SMI1/KNR4 family protein [Gemmataceae bacterium]|nr:SMI1/KNR4 family protein [Gemmataceae bacterium]